MTRHSLLRSSVFTFFFLTIFSSLCHASTIGVFGWNDDETFGPIFSVENFSSDPNLSLGPPGTLFSNVAVTLVTDQGNQSFELGSIDPGTSRQTIDDLSGFVITSASLDFDLTISGTLITPILTSANTSVLIDFTPFTPPSPVPIPSSFFLMGSALAGGGVLWRLVHRTRS
jgi:hypothetical protein